MSEEDFALQYLRKGEFHGHRHYSGYLAVVLDGAYEETSGDGKFVCGQNCVVAHPPFHWHTNRVLDKGAVVLNIELDDIQRYSVARLSRLEVEHLRNCTTENAKDILLANLGEEVVDFESPAIVERARAIIQDNPTLSIKDLSGRVGTSPEHLARQFRRFTGLTPIAYRADCRVRSAIGEIRRGESLTDVASGLSFADQSHLGREVKRVTGHTPTFFRTAHRGSHNRSNMF